MVYRIEARYSLAQNIQRVLSEALKFEPVQLMNPAKKICIIISKKSRGTRL